MLGNKLATNYYWYNDEYMYFSFNGHHSSKYHLFIQNTKDLTIENTVGAASEYSNAMMQEGTYYLGTSRKQKTFKRKCAAEIEDMLDYKRMMKWLTPGTTGELVFDSNKYWGWTVVLDTVGDATFVKRGKYIVVEFDITFKTIGTYLAHSVYPASWYEDSYSANDDPNKMYLDIIGTNIYGIPVIIPDTLFAYGDNSVGYFLQNISNVYQTYRFSCVIENYNNSMPQCDIIIQSNVLDNESHLMAQFDLIETNSDTALIEYNHETSMLYMNGQIAEENPGCIFSRQTGKIINFPSQEPIELYTIADDPDNNITGIELDTTNQWVILHLDEDSFNTLVSGSYHYINITCRKPDFTPYSITPFSIEIGQVYETDTLSFFSFDSNFVEAEGSYIGNYFIDTTNRQVIIRYETLEKMFKDNIAIVTTDTCHIYCGYSNGVMITIAKQSGNITSANMTVYSYNNL